MKTVTRHILGLATAALATGALLQPVAAEDIVAAQYGNSTSTMPYAVSMAKGFFKEAGADITGILGSIGGGNDVRNLIAEKLPYAEVALPSAVAAMQKGADLVIVSENVQNAASAVWVAMPNSPINSVKDLKGKKIGFSSPQSFTQAAEFLMLYKAGYKKGDVTMVSTGGFGPGLTALETGGIDVAVIPLTDLIASPGKYKIVMKGVDSLPPVNNTVGVVPRKTLQERPQVVRAIIEGRRKGIEYMKAHREESADIIAKAYKMEPAVVMTIMKMLIDEGSVEGIPYWGVGNINYAGLENMLDAARISGLVVGEFDVKKYVDESALPADLRSKAK